MKRCNLINLSVLLLFYMEFNLFKATQSAIVDLKRLSNKTETKFFDSNIQLHYDSIGITQNDFFFVSSTEVSWFAADYFCKSNGWHLVPIRDLRESVQLDGFLQLYKLNGTAYWTAGNRLADKKNWYWDLYDDTFTYTNWGTNNPETSKPQYCLYHKTQWFDRECEKGTRFICTKDF